MIKDLQDAIAHAKDVVKEQDEKLANCLTDEGRIKCAKCAAEHSQLVRWLEELAERREADRWILVSERLPDEGTQVLVSCEDMYLARLNPCVGWRNGQYWHTFSAKGYTQILYPVAWKPLPKPYESKDK